MALVLSLLMVGISPLHSQSSAQERSPEQQRAERLERIVAERTQQILGVMNGRGFLGVEITELTPDLRGHFGAAPESGVLIARLTEGGPAEAAGLEVGDVLVAFGDRAVDSGRTLGNAVRIRKGGEEVAVVVIRDRERRDFSVAMAEREPRVVSLRPRRGGDLQLKATPSEGQGESWSVDVDEALAQLESFLGADSSWEETLRSLEGLDLSQVEERVKQVEQRLRELERQLPVSPEASSEDAKSKPPRP